MLVFLFFISLALLGIHFYVNHGDLTEKPDVPPESMVFAPHPSSGPETSVETGTDSDSQGTLQTLGEKEVPEKTDPTLIFPPPPDLSAGQSVLESDSPPSQVIEFDTGAVQGERPIYEVFDKENLSVYGPGEMPVAKGNEPLPLVAIIIDDVGFDKTLAMAFSRLHPNITMAILPGSPFGRSLAERLHVRGCEIMLHLPMEPLQYPAVDPGPGAIMTGMSPDELLQTLRNNLDLIPHVKGVNNHMGSRLTTRSDQMRQVFTVLKKRELFFIDSLTAGESVCRDSARLFQLAFARRDVFLDNIQDKKYISGQISRLIGISRHHGAAIGIGHPYRITLATLEDLLPKIQKKARIVRASQLVAVPQ